MTLLRDGTNRGHQIRVQEPLRHAGHDDPREDYRDGPARKGNPVLWIILAILGAVAVLVLLIVGAALVLWGAASAPAQKFVLIDVREESEFAKDHLPGALHLGKGVIERDI